MIITTSKIHMLRRLLPLLMLITVTTQVSGQINTEQVLRIGANTHYFEDYVLSIQYFNQVISVNPSQAKPYFYRAVAKLNLDDFRGAEEDATLALERNPFITEAYEVRGVARQNQGKNAEAIADYDRALEMQPENSSIIFNKAIAQHENRDTVGAKTTFSHLIRRFPKFEEGYLGRARLRLEMKDTIGAKADIDHALSLNSNAVNAYLLRADIAIHSGKDFKSALADMDKAVKLRPEAAGFYINRAYLRYMNDDIHGAFEDYDRAIGLEPANTAAIFNRGLLRAEVHDTNRAIDDFSRVLDLDCEDYKTLYNRAILLSEIGSFEAALADLDKVIEAFPDFAGAYFLRYDIKRRKGDSRSAQKDYDKSMALAKTTVQLTPDKQFSGSAYSGSAKTDKSNTSTAGDKVSAATQSTTQPKSETITETQEQVKRRFSSLTTVRSNYSAEKDYSTADIRGKVQDKDMAVELEPPFMLTYYTSPNEINPSSEYIREVDEINSLGLLRFVLQVARHPAQLPMYELEGPHRQSISYYNSYMAGHAPRAIDYFGRAMDLIALKDYDRAIADLNEAARLTPDFALAYLLRAQARYETVKATSEPGKALSRSGIMEAIADLDETLRHSPFMPVAYYNKGVLLAECGSYVEAIEALTRAIELKPVFGEAYYNRGFVYLSLGDKSSALPDLSRAGELGIVAAYPLLKRMK